MKLYFSNFKTKFLILISLLISQSLLLKFKNKQLPLVDNQYRQAEVPPMIAVMFDVPAYGKMGLYQWSDYIQANKDLILKNKKEKNAIINKSYADKLKRIGMMKAVVG